MFDIIKQIAAELGIKENQANSAITLLDQGNTVPFIARYRKEVTGGLSDEVLRQLSERLEYIRKLQERKEEVIRLITEQGKMTDELEAKINAALSVTEVDDLYRPYRPKRQTKATIAKEKGLDPLATVIWEQKTQDAEIDRIAAEYINTEKGVGSADDAVQGAKDIVAEMISDDAELRKKLRAFVRRSGQVVSKPLVEESTVYDMYYDFSEPVTRLVPHRVLALNRAETEKVLSIKIDIEEEDAYQEILRYVLKTKAQNGYLKVASEDALKRLIAPSIEREIRKELTEKAEEQAIKVFGENLRSLLLQAPVKGKTVLALDPGFRTGNKVAVVDQTGKVLATGVVYMTLEHHDIAKAESQIKLLIEKYNVDLISIGNGTASKETEKVVARLIKTLDREVKYIIVSEAGASVYSASKLGTEEFPEYDVALRSAVSIGRRLQDPLAELVKIDPKAIGVGQYQHDVNQKRLEETLGGVVEDCVNQVGVDVNTASPSLLSYISGITAATAKNIVSTREKIGKFSDREQLKSVPKLGEKAFQQCAGFLRIPGADNILDNTAIHPESYGAVKTILKMQGYSLSDPGELGKLRKEIDSWDVSSLAKKGNVGEMTLKDIFSELKKPGRDPRDDFKQPEFRSDIMGIEDLKPGMILTGTVRNVIDFGAFVDIGVHQDGLVHISEMSNSYVKRPLDVVKPGDIVKVKVLNADKDKGRISLSMKDVS